MPRLLFLFVLTSVVLVSCGKPTPPSAQIDTAFGNAAGAGWQITQASLSGWEDIPHSPQVITCTFSAQLLATVDHVRPLRTAFGASSYWVRAAAKGGSWPITGRIIAHQQGEVWEVDCSLDGVAADEVRQARKGRPATALDPGTIYPDQAAAELALDQEQRAEQKRIDDQERSARAEQAARQQQLDEQAKAARAAQAARQQQLDEQAKVARAEEEARRTKAIEQATSFYLSDLPEQQVKVGWGAFGKGSSLGYPVGSIERIIVGGQTLAHGLSMVPVQNGYATATYALPPGFTRLSGAVALLDGSTPASDTIFTVLCDGAEIWHSPPINATNRKSDFDVALPSAARQLEVRTACTGSINSAHVFWVDPKLVR